MATKNLGGDVPLINWPLVGIDGSLTTRASRHRLSRTHATICIAALVLVALILTAIR